MPVTRIHAIDDPLVADFRVVSDPELMRTRGLFVAEGQLAVARLLASRFRVRALLLTDSAYDRLEEMVASVSAPSAAGGNVEVLLTDSAQLRELTGFRFHRGCLGLGERPPATADSLVSVPDDPRPVVALDAVADPDNVGSIFRSAAAFDAAGVILSATCADPLYRKAIRTSMGTTLQLPFAVATVWSAALAPLRDAGARIVALTPDASATELESFVSGVSARDGRRLVLLFGNEGDGVSGEALAHCDERVRIAIDAAVDSLNVATTAAIVLQRVRATRPRPAAS